MQLIPTSLKDVVILEPKVFGDERGFFLEAYNEATFRALGLPTRFVQDNHSGSRKGRSARASLPVETTAGQTGARAPRRDLRRGRRPPAGLCAVWPVVRPRPQRGEQAHALDSAGLRPRISGAVRVRRGRLQGDTSSMRPPSSAPFSGMIPRSASNGPWMVSRSSPRRTGPVRCSQTRRPMLPPATFESAVARAPRCSTFEEPDKFAQSNLR